MNSVPEQPGILRIGQIRRYYSKRRTQTLNLSCTPETKARTRDAASKLLMNQSEYIEWLMDKWAKGLVIVVEEGAFLDGFLKTLDDRVDRRVTELVEQQVQERLYDLGLVSSPFRK
jgi:hypothetical protein